MNAGEFLKKLRKLARDTNTPFEHVPGKGKGSHSTVYYGDRMTRLKSQNKEIGKGLLSAMCKQLGISPEDL